MTFSTYDEKRRLYLAARGRRRRDDLGYMPE
jgi:hypothetical protein